MNLPEGPSPSGYRGPRRSGNGLPTEALLGRTQTYLGSDNQSRVLNLDPHRRATWAPGPDPQAASSPEQAHPTAGPKVAGPQVNVVRGRSAALFHWFGPIYERLTDHELWRTQNLALMTHFPDRPLRRVLDLGCGTGVGTLAVARQLPNTTQVIGLDLTPQMIKRAQAHQQAEQPGDPRVRFLVGDAARTGFLNGSVDVVMGNSFLYLLPDPAAVLREIHRILRPGGRLVLMEPHAEGSLFGAARAALGELPSWSGSWSSAAWLASAMIAWRTASGLAGRRTIEAQLEMLRAAGFSKVDSHPTLGGLGVHLVAERGPITQR